MKRNPHPSFRPPSPARVSLARALSKLGVCSRAEARRWIAEGRVRVDGAECRDADLRIHPDRARIEVDGAPVGRAERVYLALHKPRGTVTTAADEQGRDTVYRCLDGAGLPWLAPVGRLDRASEGLLLFTNDTRWADAILDPASHLPKTYHVQIDRLPDAELLRALERGVEVDGEVLAARSARLLRQGTRNAWVEVVLEGGRNRQIRRQMAALDAGVLRLIRVAIGPLPLGDLPRGAWRHLVPAEVSALARNAPAARPV